MEECKDVCGGMSLSHSVVDGKHQYEVENCLTYESRCFARKRDKVLMVNNVETQDLPPEEFVLMLKSDCPMLTLHAASNVKSQECLDSDTLRTYKKEKAVLSFSLVMVQEESLKEDEEPSHDTEEELENSNIEDDSPMEGNVLLVSMTKTSVSFVTGRGCDSDHTCNSCGDMGCSFNRVVVTSKQCEVTTVCKKYIRKCREQDRVFFQSLLNIPITSETVKRTFCRSYSTSDISIYYYESNILEDMQPKFKGAPVVLNFTGSNNFLKCTKDQAHPNEPAILTVECCDKKDLQHICKDDPATWPFVFYMSTSKSNCRRFESAAHSGWFIHTKKPDTVDVAEKTNKSLTEDSFYFFIHLKSS